MMISLNTKKIKLTLTSLIILFCVQDVFAFPEMIKHGYVNCTACHVSSSGGGLLNEYGRNLSAELISTWSNKNEEFFLHGAVNTEKFDKWLSIGGDLRGVQAHTDYKDATAHAVDGRWINMQAGIEIGIIQPKWAAVAFIGEFNSRDRQHKNEILPYSPRHYFLFNATDEISIKLGRFQPNFGLNLPDHFLATRAPLGFGYVINKNSLEASYLGENWNLITSIYNIPSQFGSAYSKGAMVNVMRVLSDKYKFGLQFLSEVGDSQKRNILGITSQLGWSEHLVTLVELDRIINEPNNNVESKGLALTHRTQYEIFKGFNIAALNDYYQSNLEVGSTKIYKLGPGVIWYPRPHFDFQLFATREYRESLSEPGVYAWLMTHYYF